MKKTFLTLFCLLIISWVNLADAQTWKVDPAHSSIMFNAKHYGISFINGRFQEFEGSVTGSDGIDFSNAIVSFKAQVQSIYTGVEGRDNHLRSEDFFDAENHPELTFVSKSFEKTGEGKYNVTGDLTMRGNTKEVVLTVAHFGTIDTRNGGKKAGFQIKGTVNRFDFGVGGAKGSVAENIELLCNIEAALEK